MTESALAAILATQLPDAEKRARAAYIIDTGTPIEATRAQVAALVACVGDGEGG
jgi:dephospho-CoA kinase